MKILLTFIFFFLISIGFSQDEEEKKRFEFEMCEDDCFLTLNYFSDSLNKGDLEIEAFTDNLKTTPISCLTIWVYDQLTDVAKVYTNPSGIAQILGLKPGIYDIEFNYNEQYFRIYDLIISKFKKTSQTVFLTDFTDRKTYMKAVRKHANQ